MNVAQVGEALERAAGAINIAVLELDNPHPDPEAIEQFVLECFRSGLEALRIMRGRPE